MKERPIIFNTEMVRAILDGQKTQTRRVVKPSVKGCTVGVYTKDGDEQFICPVNVQEDGDPWTDINCPYGQIGDRLYVRETWYQKGRYDFHGIVDLGGDIEWSGTRDVRFATEFTGSENGMSLYRKRPSIHMPKWAARIWLEITDIRVERVKDVTSSDAVAEGILEWRGNDNSITQNVCGTIPRTQFMLLWNSIYENRGYGWDSNPWVWVIDFKVVEK